MNKVSFCVDETVQRRLTLGGLFVNSVGVVNDEMMEFYLRNENRGKIPELLSVALCLSRDQRIALTESAKTDSPLITIPSQLAKDAEEFWKVEYDIKDDFARLQIPRQPLGYKARLVVMHEKASQSPEFLFQSDKKAYGGKAWKFTDESLDDLKMIHQFTGTFGFWVADEQEAPDGCIGGINLNTVAVDELNRLTPGSWNTETLPMRQVHGRAYWSEHKVYLDQKVFTFCAASRLPGGGVPAVGFSPHCGTVDVRASDPERADENVRFRREVSRIKGAHAPFCV